MNPSVDDRLNSVLRALQNVVLPALPPQASLAQEQVMLAMGHIQIIQAQLDATPTFEAEELADLIDMSHQILAIDSSSTSFQTQLASLKDAMEAREGHVRDRAETIRSAIDVLLQAAHSDTPYHQAIRDVILASGRARTEKDRQWFSAMGFDAAFTGA
ncbi:MAG: hypothetical protein ACFBZ9_01720 [Sphingomonadales bacterium]